MTKIMNKHKPPEPHYLRKNPPSALAVALQRDFEKTLLERHGINCEMKIWQDHECMIVHCPPCGKPALFLVAERFDEASERLRSGDKTEAYYENIDEIAKEMKDWETRGRPDIFKEAAMQREKQGVEEK